MKVSKRGREEIVSHEGIVLRPYKDTVGVWTIGVGHTRGAGLPDPAKMGVISREYAMEIFADDLGKFERRVAKAFPQGIKQTEFDGGSSFDFNTGAIHKATWVKKFNRSDVSGARKSFMAWRKPPEIIGRRKKERDLFFDGVYSSGGAGVQRKVKTKKPLTPDDVVKEAQQLLTDRGFNPGAVDGWMGKNTKAAVIAYQKQHPDLTADGIIGRATLSQLRRDAKSVKDALKSGSGAVVVGTGGASLIDTLIGGINFNYVFAAIALCLVLLLAYQAWKYRDIIERRLNGIFGKEVA